MSYVADVNGATPNEIAKVDKVTKPYIEAVDGVLFASMPLVPTASAATNVAISSFTANWGIGTGATGYYLDVATDSGFTSFVTGFNNLDVGNVLTYNVTGLSSGTTYYYRVRSYNTVGTSASSNTIGLGTLHGFGNSAIDAYSSDMIACWIMNEATGQDRNNWQGYWPRLSIGANTSAAYPGKRGSAIGQSIGSYQYVVKNSVGRNIYVSTTYPSVNGAASGGPPVGLAISMWLKVPEVLSGDVMIFDSYVTLNTIAWQTQTQIKILSSGIVSASWTGTHSGTSTCTSGSYNINDGGWHHVFITLVNHGRYYMYVDGVWRNNSNLNSDDQPTNSYMTMYVGSQSDTNVLMDEVYVWKHSLIPGGVSDTTVIGALYNGGNGRFWF